MSTEADAATIAEKGEAIHILRARPKAQVDHDCQEQVSGGQTKERVNEHEI